ncbi:MarR family winged helix-turn-helix transcriptional regulator [Paenibacillus sp. OAS669]|uniref:MarR family winged helix-turn-helix transcriptional regulator n=1 Tax=Paenibacillus sp. OAS669 TaxID=2663821 RepID=UPI0017895C52|nr:MarR family transcriptional regulator [Paenibacillus sp. OAS669]MBE1445116.1 DNA-binding MarR family transcriptional regulator [Paenibacillus sp. OAS669]
METEQAVLEQMEETSRRIMRKLVSYGKYVDRRFSGSQVSALQTIEFYGSLKVSQLAECLSLSSSAVTLLCDKLIHNGYLQRERSLDDRRVVCLVITPLGKEMLQQLLDKEKEVISRWLTGISLDEMKQFSNTLHRIRENVKKL